MSPAAAASRIGGGLQATANGIGHLTDVVQHPPFQVQRCSSFFTGIHHFIGQLTVEIQASLSQCLTRLQRFFLLKVDLLCLLLKVHRKLGELPSLVVLQLLQLRLFLALDQ